MTLWNYLKKFLLKNPTQTVSEDSINITFEELVRQAEGFGRRLKSHKCCAILCTSEMFSALSILACFSAEVTALPLSVRYGESHCKKILDSVNPDAIITDTLGKLEVYSIRDGQYVLPTLHPAVIMCTSGTTGKPKGAMLSEQNIISNVSDIADYFDISATDAILISRPLYHCAVLTGEFLTAIVKGTAIRFYSGQFNPAVILELIEKYNITVFCGTPTLISLMARFNRNNKVKALKHICISGECMDAETGSKIYSSFPSCNIYHVYGLTEACPRVSCLPPKHFKDNPDCVGLPLRSVSIKILNEEGCLCRKNEDGVLWIKGDNVMLGYYGDPEASAKVLKDGWLCTGDIATVNKNGFLKIKGRRDGLIIRAGMNIYPSEIETALRQDPRIKEIIAYGFEDRFGTQIGIKAVGDLSSSEELKQLCLEVLPSFQIPSVIEIVDELPKNGSGKIIRR